MADDLKRRAQMSLLSETPSASTQPTNTTMPVDRPSWHVQPAVGVGAPSGFDQKNWDDPSMQTVKYRAGRLLHGASRPSDVASRVQSAAFQQAFPGATFDGKDKVDFRGALSEGDHGEPVGLIDVLMAADAGADTSNGLWWGAEPGGGASTSGGASMMGGVDPSLLAASDSSTLAQIMRELQAASQGEQSPMNRDAVLAMLR